jgi:hypothetical protein
MHPEELQAWLAEHAAQVFEFTDYEIAFSAEDVLGENLERYWFRDPLWNQPGYRFVSLGQDGTGGEVALWLRPHQDKAPVVFFGSEGGSGVLTASPLAFAQALAYAPLLQEYEKGDLDAPSRLSLEHNWRLSGDDHEQTEAAKDALARYRLATEMRLGQLPPFESLISIPPTMQAEFRDWVTSIQRRASERDTQERWLAAERKRQDKREKASRYAALTAGSLPPNATPLEDGFEFAGSCAACGQSTILRLITFEDLLFGLCIPCYFSTAW